jgi:hypothetical protein
MRQLNLDIKESDNSVSGFDAFGIREVIRVSPTRFTIVLAQPFEPDNDTKARVVGLTPYIAGITHHMVASDFDRVTVELSSASDFNITILGSDSRVSY